MKLMRFNQLIDNCKIINIDFLLIDSGMIRQNTSDKISPVKISPYQNIFNKIISDQNIFQPIFIEHINFFIENIRGIRVNKRLVYSCNILLLRHILISQIL